MRTILVLEPNINHFRVHRDAIEAAGDTAIRFDEPAAACDELSDGGCDEYDEVILWGMRHTPLAAYDMLSEVFSA